ncbi:hypothetical protein ACFFRR_007616 [Megaselia abdita]
MLKGLSIVVLFVYLLPSYDAKLYNKCELARDLLNKHGFDKTYLANWICLVKHESNFDTSSVVERPGRRTRYGLFGIIKNTHCKEDSNRGICGRKCEDFTDDYIDDDVECAKLIFERDGFKNWTNWEIRCKNTDLGNIPNLRHQCGI